MFLLISSLLSNYVECWCPNPPLLVLLLIADGWMCGCALFGPFQWALLFFVQLIQIWRQNINPAQLKSCVSNRIVFQGRYIASLNQ